MFKSFHANLVRGGIIIKKREKNGEKQGKKTGKIEEKTDGYSGHYVIASSRLPERRPLERCTLVPIKTLEILLNILKFA